MEVNGSDGARTQYVVAITAINFIHRQEMWEKKAE